MLKFLLNFSSRSFKQGSSWEISTFRCNRKQIFQRSSQVGVLASCWFYQTGRSRILNNTMEIAMNPRYMPHFKVKNTLSKLLNNWKGFKQIFVVHLNWFVNFFFCRIVLERLMEHMYVFVYHKKIKYHLLVEKMYPLKI